MLESLLSIAGATVLPLVRQAGQQVAGAVSFMDHLREEETQTAETKDSAEDDRFAAVQQQLQAFYEAAKQRLTGAGIDLSLPVDLGFGPAGEVQVVTAHPDALAIEALLQQDAELRSQFEQLAHAFAGATHAGAAGPGPESDWQRFEVRLASDGVQVRS